MLLVEWSESAQFDLLNVLNYIGERNESAAQELLERIERAVEHLSDHPYLYKPSLRIVGTREVVVHPNYIVIYQVTSKVEILAVVHAREQFP